MQNQISKCIKRIPNKSRKHSSESEDSSAEVSWSGDYSEDEGERDLDNRSGFNDPDQK